ncbi:MAG: 50S ribosomal protein L29 [Myxococcales bacterium]
MATAKEMRELTVEELQKRASELRENIFNMNIKHRTGALESSADIGKARKDLARVMTVLTEKQQAASAAK